MKKRKHGAFIAEITAPRPHSCLVCLDESHSTLREILVELDDAGAKSTGRQIFTYLATLYPGIVKRLSLRTFQDHLPFEPEWPRISSKPHAKASS